jgi:prolipoprotein diacylglyceryltransferase
VLRALDAAIPAIPLAQAFGRWGNYFNQELFGTPTTLPWALEVDPEHRPERYAADATFHPTFLYESLYNLLVVAVLIRVGATRRLRPGSLALLYLVLYGAGRFLLELLRTDTTFRLFGLSRNAYVSLAAVVGGSVWLFLRERRGRAGEEPAAASAAEDRGPAAAGDAAPAADAEARAGGGEVEGGQDREEAPAGGRDEADQDRAQAPASGRDEAGGRARP